MNEFIEKKTFKLKILTPLHISDGAEDEIIPTEYVISDDKILHRINLPRFINLMPENRKTQLDSLLENANIIELRRLIKTCWQESPETFAACIKYSTNAGDLYNYYAQMETDHEESQLQLTPFIRSNGKLLIPGSSVKGAFRTALISEIFPEEGIDKPPQASARIAQDLEAECLQYRKPDPKTGKLKNKVAMDPLKCLKIGDAFIQGNDISTIRKVHNICLDDITSESKSGKEKDIKLFAEFINQDAVINLNISLDTRYFKTVKWKIGRQFSIRDVIISCRKFYNRLLLHEKNVYFDVFGKRNGGSTVSDLYDELLEENSKKDTFIMRLGRYGGRNSVSFNIRNKQKAEPKSRNLIFEGGTFLPTGWIQVSCINE